MFGSLNRNDQNLFLNFPYINIRKGLCQHHHTVKVAMCAYSFVCTLVNMLVLLEKTPPAEVAVGDDHHECKWSICIIVDGRKTPPAQVAQCLDHLGHKYRSGMQQPNAACTRALL